MWIPREQLVEVAGTVIPGGLLYVGTSLKTPTGETDPCLIDPSKPVSTKGDFSERQTNYWPSYSEISSSARRAYLNWLADGRRDPKADIGYVFLFFYGLERRAIIDASKDEAARADWPVIADEIRRLLAIYGNTSNSFKGYASELLNWVALAEHPAKSYAQPVADYPRTFELPLAIRLALGQAAVDGAPVPAHLALAWVRLDPTVNLRTPAIRCADEFADLFKTQYALAYGVGMVVPANRTKLKFVYRGASAGLRAYGELKLNFGDTPDVSALTAPQKRLQGIVDAATKDLEAYSRFLGRNPDDRAALEGLLLLPAALWPESAQKILQGIKTRMGSGTESGMVMMSFQELLASLDAKAALTKDKTLALARALESLNIGIEPDVLGGAMLPKPEEKVVLFVVPPGEVTSRATPAYQAAVLTLQLSSAVASAEGEFGAGEIGYLRGQVQSWTHLTPNHRRRLLAHLRLLIASPASLPALKKRIEPLEVTAREAVAAFMATVAQSDGTVSAAEVRILEKVYKALGVDSKKVFGDVHAAASGAAPAAATSRKATGPVTTGLKLDPVRIAALQLDSEKVSALLASIFTEADESASARQPTVELPPAEIELAESEQAANSASILGLDESHTALARMLLSRPKWSRAELLDLAADLDLMLDGALERINEASFDIHDIPFTEGDDPVEVHAEVLEKIAA
ncbi:MAG: TerB N-terminal domain-containing protein [Burkholderiaceae bacterium]|nr:TerB N-terminal domain-containing protein [Burkholderiaceae bacterium]